MSLLVILIPLAVCALLLLIWSIVKIVGDVRRGDQIPLKHCLSLFVSLSLIDLFVCGFLLVAAGLGHSSASRSVAPLQCLLSFILLVVCPVGAVLLYRYHRASGAGNTGILIGSTVVAIAAAIVFVAAGMGVWPLLMYSLRNGHTDFARFLITSGVNINSPDRFGMTPIAYCAFKGDRDTAKLLLDNGADANLGAPLLRAVATGDRELVELLLDRGADVNAQPHHMTPLMTASRRGNSKIVELLLDRGADINARGAHGTALVRAAQNKAPEVVKLLIRRGADLNLKTGSDETALMRASSRGFLDIATMLLEHGADVHVKNYRKATALTLAAERGHTEIRDLLVAHGANEK